MKIPKDIIKLDQKKFNDERGYLNCIYETSDKLILNGFSTKISHSKKNVARGMHWQNEKAPQKKIISVLKGKLIDFLINLDKKSQDFGSFYYFSLSSDDLKTIIIPEHYGHGFLALEETIFLYNCLGSYSPPNELAVNIVDLISHNSSINTEDIILSDKDKNAPKFSQINF